MCKCIVKDYPSLVGDHNIDNETPGLFLAALQLVGKQSSFMPAPHLYVLPLMNLRNATRSVGGQDGETILHCAMDGGVRDC